MGSCPMFDLRTTPATGFARNAIRCRARDYHVSVQEQSLGFRCRDWRTVVTGPGTRKIKRAGVPEYKLSGIA